MLQIKPARWDDAEAAFEIRREAILDQCHTAYTAEQLALWTNVPLTERYRAWVARDYNIAWWDGVAVATGFINIDTGELGAIFVRPAFMRRGIGRRVVDHLEGVALRVGRADVNLEATLNAVEFYRSCSFSACAQSVYHSPSGLQLACVPMVKALVKQGLESRG